MKQYNIGRWVGAYYVQLQYSAGYLMFVNFTMLAGTLWVTAQSQLQELVGWLTFPYFMGIALVGLFVVLPLCDYVFMMRARMSYQNEQSWKHENPALKKFDNITEELKAIRTELFALRRDFGKPPES